jgi:hypothetical protein
MMKGRWCVSVCEQSTYATRRQHRLNNSSVLLFADTEPTHRNASRLHLQRGIMSQLVQENFTRYSNPRVLASRRQQTMDPSGEEQSASFQTRYARLSAPSSKARHCKTARSSQACVNVTVCFCNSVFQSQRPPGACTYRCLVVLVAVGRDVRLVAARFHLRQVYTS